MVFLKNTLNFYAQQTCLHLIRPPLLGYFVLWQTGEVAKALARAVRPEARVPGRARRASTEETARLVTAYRAGATVEEVARQFEMHDTTVSGRLADAAVVLRTEVRPSERSWMLELFSEGLSMNQVARHVGRDPKTVRTTIIAAGLAPLRVVEVGEYK